MCGINLILDRTCKLNASALDKMLEATYHRGPHNMGSAVIRNNAWQIFLGANRLRISDNDDASDQPFHIKDDKQYLLFNGEIYNHPELKNELLGLDVHFRTASDTEILYRFFQIKGQYDPDRLNGMFAIIFLNLDRNEIVIARDRWGMKPLYFYQDEKHLIISSEIKGILATGLVKKEFNRDQIPHYLRYRYASPDKTFFKNIYPFAKGFCYRFGLDKNSWTEERFSSKKEFSEFDLNRREIITKTEDLLVDSIITHTSQRFPVGILSSGGVDSTLLLALSRKHHIPLPYLFSIFEKNKTSGYATMDRTYSKKSADIYGGQEVFVEYDNSILDELSELIHKMDQPVADGAALLTYLLTREVLPKTHVVLSGAGADELFGGYNRHRAFVWYLRNYSRIQFLKEPLSKVLNLIPLGKNIPGRKKLVLLKKFLEKVKNSPFVTFDNFMALNRLSDIDIIEEWPELYYEEYLQQALERDRNEYLPEDVLVVNDRYSMLNHVEMRMPYLDRNVSEFVDQIPAKVLLEFGSKWILKEILTSCGGKIFSKRPKEGFGFPFGLWIRQKKNYHLVEYMRKKDDILEPFLGKTKLHHILNEHLSGKADNSQEIWSILILIKWIENNFS